MASYQGETSFYKGNGLIEVRLSSPTGMTGDIFDDTMSSLPELLGFSKVIQKAYEAVSGSVYILAEKITELLV